MDKNKIAVEVFNKHVNAYQDKFMNVDMYSESLDLFCNSIAKKNAQILEIACGPGNITKYLSGKRPDFKILGTDLSPNMIELAKINNPKAEFELMDARKINTIERKFDGIMCGFCLPYLTKEESLKLIRDASDLLNPKGLLYISTMEDDHVKSGLKKGSSGDEIFMHYHQADYLTMSLEKNNLKIIDLQRKVYFQGDIETKDLIIVAGKA